jgi:N-acyl-L-homoserine lactone synthetase
MKSVHSIEHHEGPSMRIQRLDDEKLSPVLRASMAGYRYQVFVEQLKWELPCAPGHEQDEFDRPGATHLIATDEHHRVVGYARLLPTTEPYLLARHFAHLLNGHAAPCSPSVWELSRFTSAGVPADGRPCDPNLQTRIGKCLLLEAVKYVQGRGCSDLVFCTTVAIERLAHRWGVEIRRLGPPHRSAAGLLVAAQIRCSSRTIEALAPEAFDTPQRLMRERAPAPAEWATAD